MCLCGEAGGMASGRWRKREGRPWGSSLVAVANAVATGTTLQLFIL